MDFKEFSVSGTPVDPFTKIGKDWMLITAGGKDSFNTMTASWGGMGVLWNKNVVFTFIRPSRYTFEFTEQEDYFSLCFFSEEYRRALTVCGRVSGRDCDKAAEAGLTPVFLDGVPCFEEANTVLICKKLYSQPLTEQSVIDESIKQSYNEGDPYHKMYIGEIVKAYTK